MTNMKTALPRQFTAEELQRETKLITKNKPFAGHLIPVLKRLASDSLSAKSTMVESDKLYLVVHKGNRWQVHKHGCRDVLLLMTKGGAAEVWVSKSAVSLKEVVIDSELREQGFGDKNFEVMDCCKGESRIPVGHTQDTVKGFDQVVQTIYTEWRKTMLELFAVWESDDDHENNLYVYEALIKNELARYAVQFKRMSKTPFGFIFTVGNEVVYRCAVEGRRKAYTMKRLSKAPARVAPAKKAKTQTIAGDPVAVFRVMKSFLDAPRLAEYKKFFPATVRRYDIDHHRLYGKDGYFIGWQDNGTPLGMSTLYQSKAK